MVPVPALKLLPSAMGLVDCSVRLAFCVVMSPLRIKFVWLAVVKATPGFTVMLLPLTL